MTLLFDPILAWDDAGLLLLSQLSRTRKPRCACDAAGILDQRCRISGECKRGLENTIQSQAPFPTPAPAP